MKCKTVALWILDFSDRGDEKAAGHRHSRSGGMTYLWATDAITLLLGT